MANEVSRRRLLTASAAATAGGAVAVALSGEPAQAAPVGSARIGRVVRQIDDAAGAGSPATAVEVALLRPGGAQVTGVVTVAVAGFPTGWVLRTGDRVVVTGADDPDRPLTAMPLVTRLVGRVQRTGTDTVVMAGQRLHLRVGTLETASRSADATYEAYVIGNDLDGTLSCTTLRPVS